MRKFLAILLCCYVVLCSVLCCRVDAMDKVWEIPGIVVTSTVCCCAAYKVVKAGIKRCFKPQLNARQIVRDTKVVDYITREYTAHHTAVDPG
ncbi:MAG: hypothetical protein LBB21_00605 [Holosporaceae bacterium]|jgi:hypothetical protein|nr:hypothetical protein [Holosporaceae bacterium]